MTYEQAFADHAYLWSIGAAGDMTGGYVDQEDLARMLRTPTKPMAKKCLCRQIEYWFQKGMDDIPEIPWIDPMVREIADRHNIPAPPAAD